MTAIVPTRMTVISILELCKLEEFRYVETYADTYTFEGSLSLRMLPAGNPTQAGANKVALCTRFQPHTVLYSPLPRETRVISSLVIVTRGCVGSRG
jgi:hypothetical protein